MKLKNSQLGIYWFLLFHTNINHICLHSSSFCNDVLRDIRHPRYVNADFESTMKALLNTAMKTCQRSKGQLICPALAFLGIVIFSTTIIHFETPLSIFCLIMSLLKYSANVYIKLEFAIHVGKLAYLFISIHIIATVDEKLLMKVEQFVAQVLFLHWSGQNLIKCSIYSNMI